MRKKYFISLSVCFIFCFLFTSSGFSYIQDDVILMDKRRVVKTYDFKKGNTLYVKNITGDINISTWDKEKVEVEITKRGRRDDVEVFIEERTRGLNIEVEYPRNRWNRDNYGNWNASIHFDIKIPPKADLELNSTTGDIVIRSLTGNVDAATTTGDIEIESVTGDVYSKSTTGSLELFEIFGDIEAYSTTGHIEITDSKCSNIEAKLTTGSIEVETSEVDPRGEIDLRSTTGDVTLTIPDNAKADFTAKARPRNLHSDFDIFEDDEKRESRRRRNNSYSFSFNFSPRTYRGEMNGGGCRINLSVSMGKIDIRKK